MGQSILTTIDSSPFHEGEKAMQAHVGKRDAIEDMGKRIIRPFMPNQHRAFFSQLPFLVIGSVDESGWPWASILPGKPGFVQTPDATTLTVASSAIAGDPLGEAMIPNAPLGLLGIEVASRRRNRVNVHVTDADDGNFTFVVDQSFGNCPQYIQTRTLEFVREPDAVAEIEKTELTGLDDQSRQMITDADTFFVSSYIVTDQRPDIEGVDVSHRGGKPGFVKVEGNELTIPDYPGNNAFNTLGNFYVNPKAGLVFMDFDTGDVLQLTGSVEILWEEDTEVQAYKGAERAWRVTVERGVRLSNALPFRAQFQDFSPNSLLMGDWTEVANTMAANEKRDAWRPFKIARIEDESSVIRSFYLEPNDGDGLVGHKAGQFATIRVNPNNKETVNRTYTVSSAPGESHYRISVKREADGIVSRHLHDDLSVGDIIEVKAAVGDFHIDVNEERPAVLIAGGVGITPMMSMAQHVFNEGVRSRHVRPLTILHSAQSTDARAFSNAFNSLEKNTMGAIRYLSLISNPVDGEQRGVDYDGEGYITADVLRQVLALDDYDFYLCGPPPFMQAVYDSLRSLGVSDARISAEAFGPASLARQPDKAGTSADVPVEEADEAVIEFTTSGLKQSWNNGGETLLEVAESQGVTPDYGCRSGSCGTCATKLKSGSVAYRNAPSAPHEDDEVLICCAVPAKGTKTVELEL